MSEVPAAVLDLDIGNTRTKWRCGALGGALPAPDLPPLPVPPLRVRVATVRGRRAALATAVRRRYGVAAEFAAVTPTLGGVRCGYRCPAQLGVDRWLAAVAAWRQVRAATVVVGVGTAATVDFVAGDGRHLGGCIAPGLALMRSGLGGGTADPGIRAAASPGQPAFAAGTTGTLGTTTAAAVASGVATMLVGFAEHAVAAFLRRSDVEDAVVFVTGGDAAALASAWQRPLRLAPSLVLDGLAIALP